MSKFQPDPQIIRGFPFSGYPMYKKENIESAIDYKAEKDDIFAVAYPKCGTTWITYIIHEVIHRCGDVPSMEDMNFRIVPYTELCGTSVVPTMSYPRAFKYHLPYRLIPKNPESKYIYLYRNPKDVFISRFFFAKDLTGIDLDFSECMDQFLYGNLAHGSYFDHLLSWYDHKDDNNMLFVSYEDLHDDTRKMIFKIAAFLGPAYITLLEEDEKLVQKILERTSFDYMKKNIPVVVPASAVGDKKTRSINFFRKGIVGDWKNHFSPDHKEKFNSVMKDKLRDNPLLDIYLE